MREVKSPLYALKFLEAVENAVLGFEGGVSSLTFMNCYLTDAKGWNELLLFYNDPYWNRLWVFQEIILAKQIVIVWGGQILNWERMARTRERLQRDANIIYEQKGVFPEGLNALLSGGPAQFEIYRAKRREHPAAEFDLLKIIQSRVPSQCTDSRDKVYGFLGVASRYAYNIKVDYENLVSDVYQELVEYFVSLRQSLDVICLVRRVHAGNYGFSSWIPALDSPTVPSLPVGIFNACGSTTARFKRPSPGELHMEGMVIHRLEFLSEAVPDTKNTTWIHLLNRISRATPIPAEKCPESDLVRATLGRWMELVTEYAQRTPETCESDLWEAFQLTLGSEILKKNQEPIEFFTSNPEMPKPYAIETEPALALDPPTVLSSSDVKRWIDENFIYIAAHIQHRRFSLGNPKVLMGLVPSSLELRDDIFVLAGCSVPVVLRKHGMEPGITRYQLLGDAYVHGYIHGKAVGEKHGGAFREIFLV